MVGCAGGGCGLKPLMKYLGLPRSSQSLTADISLSWKYIGMYPSLYLCTEYLGLNIKYTR